MTAIPSIIRERYHLHEIKVVPFEPTMTPISIPKKRKGEAFIEHVFLLDENGGKITTVRCGDTVSDTLKDLSDSAKEVAYVLSLETAQISHLLHA
ncbi:MAG: hypothetical protein NTZ13_02970 [Candidatus Parcubacteria bacterium]|nr:hypothetical protein [Candidatus Parcubacteria bacterium]